MSERKYIRLRGYDYSQNGAYFITICTEERRELLGKIIVGGGVLDAPQNILTQYGKIAEEYINQMNSFYEHISVEKYIVMPNHIHMILMVNDLLSGTSGTPSPTNAEIPRFVSTFKRFCNKEYGENIWQRSYHDHIIRDRNDYQKIWEYIDSNHLKWEKDCYNKK